MPEVVLAQPHLVLILRTTPPPTHIPALRCIERSGSGLWAFGWKQNNVAPDARRWVTVGQPRLGAGAEDSKSTGASYVALLRTLSELTTFCRLRTHRVNKSAGLPRTCKLTERRRFVGCFVLQVVPFIRLKISMMLVN